MAKRKKQLKYSLMKFSKVLIGLFHSRCRKFFVFFSFFSQKLRADQTNLAVTSVLTLCSRLRVGVPLSSQRGRKSKSREKKEEEECGDKEMDF